MLLTYKNNPLSSKTENQEEKRLHFYENGEEIPLLEEGIWQVYKGLVQLSTVSVTAEEVLLGWAQPTTFFGRSLTNLEYYQAKAATDVYLRWYYLSEIENSPSLASEVFPQLLRRIKQTEALLSIAGIRRVEDRLQQLLVLLKQEIGESVSDGIRLTARFTHQSIANTINTTRVTVTRLLGEFQRQGLIRIDSDRHIVILRDWE